MSMQAYASEALFGRLLRPLDMEDKHHVLGCGFAIWQIAASKLTLSCEETGLASKVSGEMGVAQQPTDNI